MRKSAFCICENKWADQLHGNRTADQCLCFCYKDSHLTTPLLPIFKISNILPSSVVEQFGLCQTWSETMKTGFLATWLISLYISEIESALLCSQCTSGPNGTCVTSPPSATECPHSTHNVNCMTTKTYNDNGKILSIACRVILHAFLSSADFFFQLLFFLFKKIYQEYHESVKHFGSRSCLTF